LSKYLLISITIEPLGPGQPAIVSKENIEDVEAFIRATYLDSDIVKVYLIPEEGEGICTFEFTRAGIIAENISEGSRGVITGRMTFNTPSFQEIDKHSPNKNAGIILIEHPDDKNDVKVSRRTRKSR